MDRSDHNIRPQHQLANYQFSSDELRALRECNVESFYQRSLPLGTAFGLAAYFGIQQGYLSRNVRYGAVPKVVVGVVVGYFMGKFSYQQKCAEKIMRIPNSRLGEILRQRQNQASGLSNFTPETHLGVGMTISPFTSSNADVYTDEHLQSNSQGSALNLDVESRPTFSGLDDIYRPSLDTTTTQVDPNIPIESVKPDMTYDELRQRHREEYAKKQQNSYARPLPSDAPVVIRERPVKRPEESTRNVSTNKYGDAME